MSIYQLPYFDPIDLSDLDEYYDTEIEINGNKVSLNITFDDTSVGKEQMDAVKTFIENLDKYDTQNNDFIKADYENPNGDTVKYYLEHHLKNIDKESLTKLVDITKSAINQTDELLTKLKLVRVALYPHSEDYLTIFDYSLGQDISNYLVVISTDKNGNLHHMTMES